ncbi:MAG: DNA polymerase III subunit beta [Pseudomonadota bacterium]
MKITVNKDDLLPALERARRLVERRNTIPTLANIKLEAIGDRLTVTATDLDMQATATLPAEVAEPGEMTAPAHTLGEFVKKLEAGSVTIAEADGKAAIRSGRSRASLNTLPPGDFPDLALGEFSHGFDLPADALATMIARVSFAISTEETRYYLNGIYLHHAQDAQGAPLRAVATDGHRLALHQVEMPAGGIGMPGIILPRKAVTEIEKLVGGLKDAPVHIDVSATKLRLATGDTVFATKLIDGTFPDYSRVIPAANDKLVSLDKAALAAAVDRVSTIASERGRAVKCSLNQGRLTLTVTNPDSGDATEDLVADYAGSVLDIGFNSRYVLDILSAFPAARVHVALADPGSPALFTIDGAAAPVFVLMPMRV